jgi:hypothetical protein
MKALTSLALNLAIYLAVGCSAPAPPQSNYDPRDARDTLITALDAWQADTLQQLAQQHPPLRLSDDDLIMGAKLESYQLNPDATFAPHQDVQVDLVLRDRQGTTISRRATYQIVLAPTRVILRNDP